MSLGSTAVRVKHAGPPDSAAAVLITHLIEGNACRLKGKGIVIAGCDEGERAARQVMELI